MQCAFSEISTELRYSQDACAGGARLVKLPRVSAWEERRLTARKSRLRGPRHARSATPASHRALILTPEAVVRDSEHRKGGPFAPVTVSFLFLSVNRSASVL